MKAKAKRPVLKNTGLFFIFIVRLLVDVEFLYADKGSFNQVTPPNYHLEIVDPQENDLIRFYNQIWAVEQHDILSKSSSSCSKSAPADNIAIHTKEFHYLIISGDSTPCGFLYCQFHREVNIVSLDSFFLEKQFRGKGIGSEILQQVIQIFQKEGVESIVLNVMAKNVAALRLYEKVGFITIAESNESGIKVLVMKKDLKPLLVP